MSLTAHAERSGALPLRLLSPLALLARCSKAVMHGAADRLLLRTSNRVADSSGHAAETICYANIFSRLTMKMSRPIVEPI